MMHSKNLPLCDFGALVTALLAALTVVINAPSELTTVEQPSPTALTSILVQR
jgi:hypothetical protein